MAMLDVTVALTNPYTLDVFAVLRRRQRVNGFGESKPQIQRIENVRGVVYPDGQQDLARRPEAQVTTKTVTVFTRYGIRSEAETVDGVEYQPDVIEWRGNHFVVTRVEDYSSFARGHVKASCTSFDLVDYPPTPMP